MHCPVQKDLELLSDKIAPAQAETRALCVAGAPGKAPGPFSGAMEVATIIF